MAGKQAFKALMRRELLLMQRNAFVYIFKALQVSLIRLVYLSYMYGYI